MIFRVNGNLLQLVPGLDAALRRVALKPLRGKEIVYYMLNFAEFDSASGFTIDSVVRFVDSETQGPAFDRGVRYGINPETLRITFVKKLAD